MTTNTKLSPLPAPEARKGTNQFGLDCGYFEEKLSLVLRDLDHYNPEELSTELLRLSNTANTRTPPSSSMDDLFEHMRQEAEYWKGQGDINGLVKVAIENIILEMKKRAPSSGAGIYLPKITPDIINDLEGTGLIENGNWTQDAVDFVAVLNTENALSGHQAQVKAPESLGEYLNLTTDEKMALLKPKSEA